MAKEKKKLTFKQVQTFNNRVVRNVEKNSGKFIKAGDDNQFPQYLIDLYNRSSLNGACINSIVQGIVGGGLTANEEVFLDRANSQGETYNDIFKKVALDYKLHGAFCLEVIYSNDKSRIADIFHLDYSFIRAKEKDERGRIPGYFINDNWGKYYEPNKEHLYLPSFDWSKRFEENSQLFVTKAFHPGQIYYPLCDYVGALKVIELDTLVDQFHTSNLKNGCNPSLAITTFMNSNETDLKNVEEMLRANYTGTSNAGSLIFMDVPSREEKPEIEVIDPAATDVYYTTINDLVTQKILTAHRITSPLLLGIQQPGSLGNRSEMIDARILFQHNVLEPFQQEILKQLEGLLSFNYPDIVLGVQTKTLFDDGEVEEEVITSVEVTDEENEEVQKQDIAPIE